MYEGREVGTFYVTGAYLNAEMPREKGVFLKLKWYFVDITWTVNPDHENNFIIEKYQKVLYLLVVRYISWYIKYSLLWYELFSNTLKQNGFNINHCDKWVAKNLINGNQYTIEFCVDDNETSHVEPEVVTNVIDIIKGIWVI